MMAIDAKYGKVWLEHGEIGEYEPVVVFRATDKLLPLVLLHYHTLCRKEGSPARHLKIILKSRAKVIRWQSLHSTHIPDSESSRKWLEEETGT